MIHIKQSTSKNWLYWTWEKKRKKKKRKRQIEFVWNQFSVFSFKLNFCVLIIVPRTYQLIYFLDFFGWTKKSKKFSDKPKMSYIVPLDKQRRPRFYSSTATFVWSRNTVRESSHISFFRGGNPLCILEWRPENTHGGADRFAWVTSWSLPQSKITDLILSFNSHAEIWTRLFAHVFSGYGWVSELTYSEASILQKKWFRGMKRTCYSI